MEDTIIKVDHVSMRFNLASEKVDNMKEYFIRRLKKKMSYDEFWALQDINFEVKRGDSVALIGLNGCGKSTTLKMLTKIIYPDSGSIEMCGRVSSLLELGAGFHPDMSGRENIYTPLEEWLKR